MPKHHSVLIGSALPGRFTELMAGLVKAGWQVTTASEPGQVKGVAFKDQPRVVLLHADIPGGIEPTIDRLRSSAYTAGLPILAFGLADAAAADKAIRAGAQGEVIGESPAAVIQAVIDVAKLKPPGIDMAPQQHLQSVDRLRAIRSRGVQSLHGNVLVKRLAQLSAKLLRAPATLLSVVDDQRQRFAAQYDKAKPNLPGGGDSELKRSFCQWVVSSGELMIVEDARLYPALAANPACQELEVLAYAGAPVSTLDGQVIGSFCAFDSRVHRWTELDADLLQSFAQIVQGLATVHENAGTQAHKNLAELDRIKLKARIIESLGKGIAGAGGILKRACFRLDDEDRALLYQLTGIFQDDLRSQVPT